MKITNYLFAATLALLGLSCTQAYNPSQTKLTDANRPLSAWDQIKNNQPDNQPDPASLRRLESVTWDSVRHQLTWDVSKGEKRGDAYQPQSKDRYEINMDTATMTVNGETRRFNGDEAANVRKLMDFISRYALESTVWWENGEGEPVDGSNPQSTPPRQLPRVQPESSGKAIRIAIPAQ